MNRRDLEKKLSPITSGLLREKDYICLIDVFIGLEYLTKEDVESWRMKRIPYLEKSIKVNLGKISFINKMVREKCRRGSLRESHMTYK